MCVSCSLNIKAYLFANSHFFAAHKPATLFVFSFHLSTEQPWNSRCSIDLRTKAGVIYAQILAYVEILIFGTIFLSYGVILIKLRTSSLRMVDSSTMRYRNSAKLMMIFVVVFIFQWWSLVLVNIWSLVSQLPEGIFLLPVVVVNLGGVYNCLAYTVIRRRFTRVAPGLERAAENTNKINETCG